MILPALLALLAQPPVPASPAQEARVITNLGPAVQKMQPNRSCGLEPPLPGDLLTVISSYEAVALSDVTVAGQDKTTTLADIVIETGVNPINLAVSSYEPVVWRITGKIGRVRRLAVLHHGGAGVIGIPATNIRFTSLPGCTLSFDDEHGGGSSPRDLEHEVPVLAIFGRRANLIGGEYGLYRAVIGDTLQFDRSRATRDHDTVILGGPGDTVFPRGRGNGPSTLEVDFRRYFPGGIVKVDPRTITATDTVEKYAVLPQTAGAFQLEQSGALIPATAADVRRWKDRAILGGHVSADRIRELYFNSAYRVTRPIRLPPGLCGGFLLTFFVPSRDFVSGEPCHSNIYVDDGTIMYAN